MIPVSLSASSVAVSEACPARWKAENFDKAPQLHSDPAAVGSTVHFALEKHVKAVYLEGTHSWDDVKHLNAQYELGYIDEFSSTDFSTPEFADGAQILAGWYEDHVNGLPDAVLMAETKLNFPIKVTVDGIAYEIPYNYIFDRADQIDAETYRIVDYKSYRGWVSQEQMRRRIQPRSYALAGQILWPNAKRIYVVFDMLRHRTDVGIAFDRDDNIATYRYLQRAATRIIQTAPDKAEERLNVECKWCIRKTTCDTLAGANRAGSYVGLTIEELAARKAAVSSQLEALKYADEELDKAICLEAEEREQFEFPAGEYDIKIDARPRRKITDTQAITRIVGPDMQVKYGNWTVTSVDKMLKDGVLDADQAEQVKAYIGTTWSEPSAKVTKRNAF